MAVRDIASALVTGSQSLLNRIVKPETREQFYANVSQFANEQPILFSFLAIQFLLSITPILLFASFVTGLLILSLISAALFSLFWIGVALLILIPTLFVTVSLGVGIWIWGVTSWFVVAWVYKFVPAVRGNAEVKLYNGKKAVVTKEGDGFMGMKGEVRNGDPKE